MTLLLLLMTDLVTLFLVLYLLVLTLLHVTTIHLQILTMDLVLTQISLTTVTENVSMIMIMMEYAMNSKLSDVLTPKPATIIL